MLRDLDFDKRWVLAIRSLVASSGDASWWYSWRQRHLESQPSKQSRVGAALTFFCGKVKTQPDLYNVSTAWCSVHYLPQPACGCSSYAPKWRVKRYQGPNYSVM